MSDDFVQKFAANLKRKRSEQQIRDEKFVQVQRLKQELGPELWASLRDWLEQTGTKINKEMNEKAFVFEVGSSSEVTIRRASPPASLRLSFDSGSNRVRYECGVGKGEFTVEIDDNQEAYFRDAYHRRFAVEEVGQGVFRLLEESQL
jgi:hypothetical protein